MARLAGRSSMCCGQVAIDLEDIGLKVGEQVEAGVTGSEIVNGDAEAVGTGTRS